MLFKLHTESLIDCSMIYLSPPPLQLATTLFRMASRGQCENIEIGDKQVGGWAFHTEREIKPMSEKSQDVQEGKVLGDHLAQGLFYMGWWRRREEEKKDFFFFFLKIT